MTMDPSAALLAAPHYHWGCCQVCHRAGTAAEPLKRCSRCNCMHYCSPEHQKAHWKKHKKLCAYLSSAAEEIGAKSFFGTSQFLEEGDDDEDDPAKNWTRFRRNAVQSCEVLMGRKVEEWEKEMFLFPKTCRVCRKADLSSTLDCADCMGVTYCSEEHQAQDAKHHKLFCKELRFCMAMDTYEANITICLPSIPAELDSRYIPVEGEISEYLGNDGLEEMSPLDEMQHRFLCDRLSAPLTLLHYLHKHGLADKKRMESATALTVHIVGADVTEMLGIIKWEYVAHRLPTLRRIRFVFIGPALEGDEEDGLCHGIDTCDDCAKGKRKIEHEICVQPYEKYVNESQYTKPDVVAAFNCGFHDCEDWKPALRALLWQEEVPLVFTSYNREEAKKDMETLQGAFKKSELRVDTEMKENGFRGHRPYRDFEFVENRDVFYNNNFVSVVRKNKM